MTPNDLKYIPEFAELVELLEKATELKFDTAEVVENSIYDCPMCDGTGEVDGKQYINFDNLPMNVLFTGIGDEMGGNEEFVLAAKNQLPTLLQALIEARKQVEWRPIEEAPKDGTMVRLYDPEWTGSTDGYWKDICWFTSDGEKCSPTHYQPLPKPPVGEV